MTTPTRNLNNPRRNIPKKAVNHIPATFVDSNLDDVQNLPTDDQTLQKRRNRIPKRSIKQELYAFPYEESDLPIETILNRPSPVAPESFAEEPESQESEEVITTGQGKANTASSAEENGSNPTNSIETVSQRAQDLQKATVPELTVNETTPADVESKAPTKSTEDRSREFDEAVAQVVSNNNIQKAWQTPMPPTPNTIEQRKVLGSNATKTNQTLPQSQKNVKEPLVNPVPNLYLVKKTTGVISNGPHPQMRVEDLSSDLQKAIKKISKYERYGDTTALIDVLSEWYHKIPKPRTCYFERKTIGGILAMLALSDTYSNSVARLYMQIFNDLQANQTVLKLSEWTRLIDIIGKGFVLDKDVRVDVAFKAFQDMQRYYVEPDVSLLTSLLQIAVRAQRWSTASIIDNELIKRKAENLIIWTERVKIAGKQNDLVKILQTLKDFAASGLPVDIAFVNALLEALLNVGQGDIAESIYLRLRQMIAERYEHESLPTRTTKLFVRRQRKLALRSQDQRTGRDLYKEAENLIPNRSSIRRFISYHCHYSGRIGDVAFYLKEMDAFGISPNYGTYVDIFHGFFLWHKPDGDWSGEKLRNVYSVIHEGLVHGQLPFAITFVLALTAIRAHGKVFGAAKAREVWEMLRPHLRINENVQTKALSRITALESLVKMFEERSELPRCMAGGEEPYRVTDWRTHT